MWTMSECCPLYRLTVFSFMVEFRDQNKQKSSHFYSIIFFENLVYDNFSITDSDAWLASSSSFCTFGAKMKQIPFCSSDSYEDVLF